MSIRNDMFLKDSLKKKTKKQKKQKNKIKRKSVHNDSQNI